MKARGFSLLEVMVAAALSGVIAATVVATFRGSLDEQARSKHEWQAFTIAQQNMEILSALPRSDSLLAANSPFTASAPPGSTADANCSSIANGTQHKQVNELGGTTGATNYDLCWRITDGHPSGNLKNIRVIVTFQSSAGSGNVLLQTIR